MSFSDQFSFPSLTVIDKAITISIFSYLNANETGTCRRVCKKWKHEASSPFLWQNHIKKDYGYDVGFHCRGCPSDCMEVYLWLCQPFSDFLPSVLAEIVGDEETPAKLLLRTIATFEVFLDRLLCGSAQSAWTAMFNHYSAAEASLPTNKICDAIRDARQHNENQMRRYSQLAHEQSVVIQKQALRQAQFQREQQNVALLQNQRLDKFKRTKELIQSMQDQRRHTFNEEKQRVVTEQDQRSARFEEEKQRVASVQRQCLGPPSILQWQAYEETECLRRCWLYLQRQAQEEVKGLHLYWEHLHRQAGEDVERLQFALERH